MPMVSTRLQRTNCGELVGIRFFRRPMSDYDLALLSEMAIQGARSTSRV